MNEEYDGKVYKSEEKITRRKKEKRTIKGHITKKKKKTI